MAPAAVIEKVVSVKSKRCSHKRWGVGGWAGVGGNVGGGNGADGASAARMTDIGGGTVLRQKFMGGAFAL